MISKPTQYYTHITQGKDYLYIVPCKNNFINVGLHLLNHLPQNIKAIPVLRKFKNVLRTYVLSHCFSGIEEFLLPGTDTSSSQLYHIILTDSTTVHVLGILTAQFFIFLLQQSRQHILEVHLHGLPRIGLRTPGRFSRMTE
jgi:hypothetical protein